MRRCVSSTGRAWDYNGRGINDTKPSPDAVRTGSAVTASFDSIDLHDSVDGTQFGLKGPFGDQYFYPHLQLDAQASIRLGKGLTGVIYGLNLTNEVFGFYNGSPEYLAQREFYGRTVGGGLRWNPTREKF